MAKRVVTTVRLSPRLLESLGELAAREAIPRSRLIERVLVAHARTAQRALGKSDEQLEDLFS